MNPFRDTIVASPWGSTPADVPEIHAHVFERCLAGVEQVRASRRSASLLIHGEAGSGKTHLLGRLCRQLTPQAPSSTERRECLYVWVRLQTSPRMIWRTLRRTLVDDWFRPVVGNRTQFERILFHRLAEKRPATGDLERWYEYMLDEDPDGLATLMDEIATHLDLDRNTAVAFSHIAFGRHLRDLRAWLAGTSLPQAALERIDLAQDEGNDEEREDEARQVVLMLCQLAGNGLPIVLSFDQVEALQTNPKDQDAMFAFGQLMSTLHDGTTNTLLVSSVQSAFFNDLKDQVRQADYDRMTSLGAVSLDPLSHSQASRLVSRRLEAADQGIDGHWMLKSPAFEQFLTQNAMISPRRLLAWCAEQFDNGEPASGEAEEPASPAPSPEKSVTKFLEDRWDASFEQKLAANAPDQTEAIIRHGLPLLVRLVSRGLKEVPSELLKDVDLVFEGAQGRTGVSVCAHANMNSLGARLKRLKAQMASKHLNRLVIVRDSRVPISQGAKTARQYLQELEQEQATILFPSVESLAAVDALRDLLSDAKSGDLDHQGEAVAPATVEEWLTTHLASALRDFIDEIFSRTETDGGQPALRVEVTQVQFRSVESAESSN